MSEHARKLVASYYQKLWSDDVEEALSQYLSPSYLEHQYTAAFSAEGLKDYINIRRQSATDHKVVIHHTLSEGDLVFLMAEEKLGGDVDYARAEMFRLEGDLIVEHWGAEVLDDKNRKNPNGTFDGAQVNRDVDHAAQFGARFEAWDQRGFDGQELDVFDISRIPEYKQHSPKGGDGLDGLVSILSKAKAAGIKTSMTCFRTLCDGDFVVSHRLYDTEPTHPLMNRIYTFDMFRLDAEGRAVEHWDVMNPVPSADYLARM
ncbi:MAG: hypothetical protein CME88_07890 [Hirschia sp.]|nr:hypothetical protein [Hirschia sp.]